jgi:hypothetical protein
MRHMQAILGGAAMATMLPAPAAAQLIGIDLSIALVEIDARITLQGGQITVLDGRVTGTEAAIAQLQALYQTTTQQIAAQQAATAGLAAGVLANADAIVTLDNRIDGTVAAIAATSAEVTVLGGRVAGVEAAVDANGYAIAGLETLTRAQGDALIDLRADVTAGAAVTAEHGVRLETHETRLNAHETRLNTHQMRLDDHDNRLDGHQALLADHGIRLDAHETRLDGHDNRLDGHQALLVDHGVRLNAHDTRLDGHDALLGQHGATLAQHDVRIDAAAASAVAAGAHSMALRADVEHGRVGMVQQASAGAPITVGAQAAGAVVDFSGSEGARRLTGIAPGVAPGDAATMGQMAAAAGETLRAANAYTDASVSLALDRAMDATMGMMQANNRRLTADMNAIATNGAARSGLPQSFVPRCGTAGASLGGHGGEVSLALGVSKASESDRPTVFRAGAAIDTRRGEVSYNAGVGFHF